MLDVLTDTLLDVVRLIPFLFLAYLAMECLEHKAGDGTRKLIRWAGGRGRIHAGPVIGGLLGAVPQCGFSAAASNLYAGRVISLGTLIAVYLSTSDEMLPILISERAPVKTILAILLSKALIGTAAGMVIDCAVRRRGREREGCIHDICEKEHCHCEQGIVRSALSHTARIAFFILLVTLVLNLALHFAGEDALAGMLLNWGLCWRDLWGLYLTAPGPWRLPSCIWRGPWAWDLRWPDCWRDRVWACWCCFVPTVTRGRI